MMKHEVARKRTAQAPEYVPEGNNVAISKGGANVGRIILREQERNLNVIGRSTKEDEKQ
jgi:hypothetical protein